jgi:phage/plasmid-associated DNA primase
MEQYNPPSVSTLPANWTQFMASLSEDDRELHKMGAELLGSSYFGQWTHQYRKWLASTNTNTSLK